MVSETARASSFWFDVRLSRLCFAVLCAALAFGFLYSLRSSCAVLWFLRVRSNSTVLCSGVSRPFNFWLATVRFSPVYVWCCRALVAAQLQVFGEPLRVRVVLFSRFFVFACVNAALIFCFRVAARLFAFCAALVLSFCGAARLRAFLMAALAQVFGDSNNTGANVPTHGTTRRCTRPFTASLFSAVASPRGCKRRVSLVVRRLRAA